MKHLRIDGIRLHGHLAELSEYGRTPEGGVSRVAFGKADAEGRAYVMALMRRVGLDVRIDPVGNIIGRRQGSVGAAGTILFGSHIDTVPHGGNYDGGLGSMAAIEVAQTLAETGHRWAG